MPMSPDAKRRLALLSGFATIAYYGVMVALLALAVSLAIDRFAP